MMPALDTTAERTMALVDRIVSKDGAARRIGACESLTDAGVSSLDMVNLMLAIEAEFDLYIPAACVNPQNFRSVEAIARMIDAVRGTRH